MTDNLKIVYPHTSYAGEGARGEDINTSHAEGINNPQHKKNHKLQESS